MRLVQFITKDGDRRVGVVGEDGLSLDVLSGYESVRRLALEAYRAGIKLEPFATARMSGKRVSYDAIMAENRLLPPLDHPDLAHCILSGTGLDHLGSAQARHSMHEKLNASHEELTDSMKMFKLGLQGGKPAPGEIGVAPEWFYKGDGSWVVPPGQGLVLPPFALDGGEEPEIVGLYVIGDQGEVLRVGFALGNEFSDHVLEKQNYLYLAHSKLRTSSFGPELLIGDLPANIRGTVRLWRGENELWSSPFLTGEANMTHSIANIEHHHFKYAAFRRPGDVHCHFYGTATLSFAAGITPQVGDLFEISAPPFGRSLSNPIISLEREESLISVQAL